MIERLFPSRLPPELLLLTEHYARLYALAVIDEPDFRKKSIAAGRSSTTMPTLSIRLIAMCPLYNLSSVVTTNSAKSPTRNR